MPQITMADLKKNAAKPPIITIYGDAGIGKTTFAATAPNPVFIITEDGLGDLDVQAFPLCTQLYEINNCLDSLLNEDHSFETVVIDSLDWMESIIWEDICDRKGIPSIDELGYGKGYTESAALLRGIVRKLINLRDSKGMIIILVAHSMVRKVEDPMLPSFDAHDLKLHKKAAAIIQEFSDVILFANWEMVITTEDEGFGNKRARAVSSGNRLVYTEGSPSYTAKNRYSLPATLPLSWDAFMGAFKNRKEK